MEQLTCLLVVSPGTSDLSTGAGQRTRLLFDSLKQLGPTHVAILGPDRGGRDSGCFPDSASVTAVETDAIAPPRRLGDRLERLFLPERRLRSCPRAAAALAALTRSQGIDIVVFRYARTLCAVDPGKHPLGVRGVFLDWDDRDDLRYLSLMDARGGRVLARSFVARRGARAIRRRIGEAATGVTGIWHTDRRALSTPPDPRERIIRNSVVRRVDDTAFQPPSAGGYLLFVGTIWYRPNAEGVKWFLRRVWPLLSAADPDIRVRLGGGGDWREVAQVCGNDPRIEFLGYIEDIDAQYRNARAAIVPVFSGGGTQIKGIEACLYGRPVVASRFSAEGYDDDLREDMFVADTAEEFASACLHLFSDAQDADRRGASLRRKFGRKYAYPQVSAEIRRHIREEILKSAA